MPRREGGAAAAGGAAEDPASAPWHALAAEEVVRRLGTDAARGLEPEEARRRLARHGPNRIESAARATWPRVLARQFADFLIGILAVAAALSFALGQPVDGIAIVAILLLNGLLGFAQEWRAERALAALQGLLAPTAAVVRGGRELDVPAEEVVPGDVIVLAGGRRVPADVRLLEAAALEADESALTGESVPVAKEPAPVAPAAPLAERASMAWTGTVATSGHARAVVVATGMGTEFGRIAELTRSVERDATPLQRRLAVLGRQLGVAGVLVAAAVGVGGWLAGRDALEMFLTGVSLAVAVVPEGLPAVVTVTLALGVRRMVERRALPRRLQATETLGSASLVLTDKTGTLTENEMTVVRVWLAAGEVELSGTGYRPVGEARADGRPIDARERPDLARLLETGATCNRSRLEEEEGRWRCAGQPTECALLAAARKAGVEPQAGRWAAEVPFDSRRKRMTVVVESAEGLVAHAKGAPEVLLELSTALAVGSDERPLDEAARERVRAAGGALASRGLRVLALARRRLPAGASLAPEDVERGLVLLGLVGIVDPPRPEVRDAVRRARGAGIRVVVVTGDAPETATAVARRIGLEVERAISGPELDRMPDEELERALRGPCLFARTTPEHKLRLARVVGDREVVAMTGDGVNDAPALREAHIGVAMGVRGTDVAREAADLVLTDDNFASIVNAIEEGRREYDNIQKFVRYLLSSNVGEVVAISIGIVAGLPLVLLPVQILWINVVTDAVTAVSLGLEPAEGDVMRRPPRPLHARILDGEAARGVLVKGGYIGLVTLALFHLWLGESEQSLVHARSMAFTSMVVLEQANLLQHRALRGPLASVGFFSNPWLLVALAATTLLHVAALYAPGMQELLGTTGLGWREWTAVLACAVPLVAVPELRKWRRWRRAGGG